MATFKFVALDASGQTRRGVETASSASELAEGLRARGWTVLDLREAQDLWGWAASSLGLGQRLPLYPTMIMVRQLATMLKAGIPISTILDNLGSQGLDSRVDQAVFQIGHQIQTGHTLTQAFEGQGAKFPPLTSSMVRAGELSGNLDDMLERLAHYLEKDLALRRAWTQASLYPFLVFFACCGLTLGMVAYVFPTFIDLFRGLDVQLPVLTRALITVTETVRNPIVFAPVLVGLALSGIVGLRYVATPVGRRQWDWARLELPYLGPLAHKIALSRVARTLGTLLSSGLPMLTALKVAGTASGNSVLRDALERVASDMKRGQKLSDALEDHPLFPRVFVQLVQAGEDSGELAVMLMRLGDLFEEEVQLALAAFTSLIEPVMIGAMGGLVLFVLVAVFQPIYQLMAQF